MKITKQILKTHAKRLLEELREEGISSLETALKADGRKFRMREMLPDSIHIHTAPSNLGTTALKISYEYQDFEGIPIELVLNPELNYRQIIVKCTEPVSGYILFGIDDYNNVQQFKKSKGVEWKNIMQDVEDLSKLT